jgi:hypothetical protein
LLRHAASGACDYRGAIDPGDRKRAWHSSQFGLKDAGEQVGAAQPRSTIMVRPDQSAPHSRLGRNPER